MSKYNRLLAKKGYVYNNGTFGGYKYDILGGCPNNNNQLDISTTTTTITSMTSNINNHMRHQPQGQQLQLQQSQQKHWTHPT